MNDEVPRIHAGAAIGVWIGFHGWLIGVAIVAGAQGALDFLLEAMVIGIPLSSALALVTLRLVGGAASRRAFGRRLAGSIFLGVGVLLLLINHWLAPRIAGDEALRRTMEKLGGTYVTSDVVPAAFLVAALLLLWRD